MTDEQLTVPRGAITIQGDGIDLDFADLNWFVITPGALTIQPHTPKQGRRR